MVEKHSALLEVNHEEQIPVDADHRAMCKFETQEDDTKEKVHKQIKKNKEQATAQFRGPARYVLIADYRRRGQGQLNQFQSHPISTLKCLPLEIGVHRP